MTAAATLEASKRLVVKIGSALLVDRKTGLRQDWLTALVADVAALAPGGREVLIVSSGAIALGRKILKLPTGTLKLEESQAAAAVGQIALARAYAERLGDHGLEAGQILLTLGDTEERRRCLNARATVGTLLQFGAVPVINENDTVATAEIRYGDNDRLAARVATMMSADLLVLLSDIDALYSRPPLDPGAVKITEVAFDDDLAAVEFGDIGAAGVGTGGAGTKVAAAKLAAAAGTPVLLASTGDVAAALSGADIGTWFAARPR